MFERCMYFNTNALARKLNERWNKAFAKDALAWVKEHQEDLYFMPVRVGLDEYLNGVLY